jgi:hypothetical protein
MTYIYCLICEKYFEGMQWDPGECPWCKREYDWDEICTEDYSDCWPTVEWKSLND